MASGAHGLISVGGEQAGSTLAKARTKHDTRMPDHAGLTLASASRRGPRRSHTKGRIITIRYLGSGMLLLAVLFLGHTAAMSADTTPPELVNFSVFPLLIDTSTGPATISVRIEAHDDLSGFGSGSTGSGSIDIRHSSGSNPFGRGSLPITGGTLLDPVFEFSLTAPQFSLQGVYPISLTLIDNVFNSVTFSSADLAARGFPSQIEVISIEDSTPPELVSFSISPLIIDTSGGPVTLSVRIEARDDLSGFGSGSTGSGSIDIRHSSGSNPFGRGSLPITGGTALNPIFEFSLTAPQFSPLGIYPISLTLIDDVFNTVTLSSADLAARGFPSQIEISPTLSVCGNQIVELGEQCDDGDTDSGDGCSATCQFEPPLPRNLLRCQKAISGGGNVFLQKVLAARQTCLERQLKGTLSLAVDCRATLTGDERTDTVLARAGDRLNRGLDKACGEVILGALGFPGQCPDPDGPPFTLTDLQQCIQNTHMGKATELIELEFPLP